MFRNYALDWFLGVTAVFGTLDIIAWILYLKFGIEWRSFSHGKVRYYLLMLLAVYWIAFIIYILPNLNSFNRI